MKHPLSDRFWSRVNRGPVEECWPWTKASGEPSEGRHQKLYWGDGSTRGWTYVHRFSYELHHGPTDQYVLHSCDNPHCCNPYHLFAGTPGQNLRDAYRRGLRKPQRGLRKPRKKLTQAER